MAVRMAIPNFVLSLLFLISLFFPLRFYIFLFVLFYGIFYVRNYAEISRSSTGNSGKNTAAVVVQAWQYYTSLAIAATRTRII